MKFKYSLCFMTCLLAMYMPYALANEEQLEFDASFLKKSDDQTNIDLSAFNHSNAVLAGNYSSDIYVNHQWIGRDKVTFTGNPATLCITPTLADTIGLLPSVLSKKESDNSDNKNTSDNECLTLNTQDDLTKLDFSANELRLDVTIPQAYLLSRPRGYVPPRLWDEGVASAFISYRANEYQSKSYGTSTEAGSVGLNSGINLGSWHLRHSGNLNWGKDQNSHYSAYETYLQTDILALRAQAKLGDVYASSDLFDSHSFRGVQLSSDDRMLPSSQRGYAPIINGYANSNAMVVITQNGRELLNTTVPAGPFLIDDLYPTASNGDLLVTVTEADGSVRSFTVPYSTVQQLVRPGFSEYELSMGKLRSGTELYDEKGVQGTWRYGVSNLVTANTGFILADSYQSAVLGAAFSTYVGAFSFDVTYAKSQFEHKEDESGYSYRLAYSRRLEQLGTNLSLAAYRYSTDGFYTWDQVALQNKDYYQSYYNYQPKEQFQISLYQTLPEGWGNLYLVANNRRYWNKSTQENSWSMGYSNSWNEINYSVAYSNSKYSDEDKWRKELTLYVSFPFDFGTKYPAYVNTQVNKVKDGDTNSNIGISGSFGEQSQYSYGLSANHSSNSDSSDNVTVNGSARTNVATLAATYGQQSHVSQWSASASGAVVLHQGGVTATNQLGDTYAIIHAKDAAGARVLNGQNIQLDSNGYAVVPSLSPYEINTIAVDPKGIPLDVQMQETQQQIVPRANSSVFIELETKKENTQLFEFKDSQGEPIAANSTVTDSQGNMLAMIGAGGRALIEGLADTGQLTIVDKNSNSICSINYDLNKAENKQLNNGISLTTLICQ